MNSRYDLAAFTFLSIFPLIMPMGSVAWSAEYAPFNAEIGISAIRFKYDEFSDEGSVLDTETGLIPGLSFRFGQLLSGWEWGSIVSFHRGRVDYAGQTNLGAPYNTRTEEKISDVSLRLGRWLDGRYRWMPYAGLGYRRWDRDILPKELNGLFESYRWLYGWVGAKIMATEGGMSQLDIGFVRPFSPEMHVDFRGTFNTAPILHPGAKTGLRVLWASSLTLSDNTQLVMEPYFEHWTLGRSPVVATGNISVHEPASKTNNIGFNLRFGRMF
jgi:hypothetical protein